MQNLNIMQRRSFFQKTILASTILSTNNIAAFAKKPSKKNFTVAFISDSHVKPGNISEEKFTKALQQIHTMDHKPNFIINGGDGIMDAMKATKEKTAEQWQLWNKVIDSHVTLPLYNCIGNHDAWGWQMTEPEIKTDSLYNKAWAVKEYKMPNRFYSFAQKNWKFIVLDSAHENNGGYISKIDDEQFAWLETELNTTDKILHICIVSHIPIVSFCAAMFYDENEKNGDWKISRALLHTDSRKITALFNKHANIRCCLSGHIHLQDQVVYKNISYYCNGAISGNWWGGAFKGFEPAYAIFTFANDGKVERQMVKY